MRTIILLIALLFLASTVPAQSLDNLTTTKVDEIFAHWNSTDSPGCALGIIKNGKLVYTRGYGMADLEHNVLLNSQSVFYIASTSKQFTAASIALLTRKGVISLDDDIRKYLPEIPQYESTITVRHLIHHISGLRDYLGLTALRGGSFEDHIDNNEAVGLIARQKALNYKPGEQYLYSNSNYVLLAEIVKRASGKSLREFAHENIFQPLNMSHTHWDDDRSMVVKNRVVSYGVGKIMPWRHFIKNIDAVGDGNLLTTIEDLAKWDQNFYDNTVGGAGFTDYLLTRGKLNNGEEINYAFGLQHMEYRGLKAIAHGGSFLGFRTAFIRFPQQKFSVICLCNAATVNPANLSQQAADILLADQFKTEAKMMTAPVDQPKRSETFASTTTQMNEFVGSYYSDELDVVYKFVVSEGKLMLMFARQNSFLLAPQAKDRFAFQSNTLLFLRNEKGQVTGLSLEAGRVKGLHFEKRTN